MTKMTIEQEKEKVKVFQEAKTQRERDEIFQSFAYIVHAAVKNYYKLSYFEDVKQECFITLFNCLKTFDLEKNNKFTTYATFCVRRIRKVSIMKNANSMKIAQADNKVRRYYYEIMNTVSKADCTHKDLKLLGEKLKIDYSLLETIYFSKTCSAEENGYLNQSSNIDEIKSVEDRLFIDEIIEMLTDKQKLAIKYYLKKEAAVYRNDTHRGNFHNALKTLKKGVSRCLNFYK